MKMDDVKKLAVQNGIKPGKLRKAELIRTIQRAEGNPECYGTGMVSKCEQLDCSWRDDCV